MTNANKLNRPGEFFVFEKYKEFKGPNTEKMAELRSEDRTPMSVADTLQRRLDVRGDSGEVRSYWTDNYFNTGDAILRNPQGDVKIALDSQMLWSINPNTRLQSGAVPLTNDQWEEITGDNVMLVPAKKAKKLDEKMYSRESVKDSEEWNFLARDNNRLETYADEFFPEMKQRFGYDEAMGLYLSSTQDTPIMRSVFLGRLDSRSSADGWLDLDPDYGRLVGVAPEAQNAPSIGGIADTELLKVRSYMDAGEAFEHNGRVYVPVSDKRITLEK